MTVIAAVDPDLLTTFNGIELVTVDSLLNPKTPGVILIVCAPVVMTSAIIP